MIKVETVGPGDLARNLGADADPSARGIGISFPALIAAKKSLALNLKDPCGKAAFLLIVRTADVLVDTLDTWRAEQGPFLPGFGHRLHKPVDPRGPRLPELVDEAAATGAVTGAFAKAARAIEAHLTKECSKAMPLNMDGETAVIFAEPGCPAPLARGFFCFSHSVGLLAHAWEQMQQGGRNKVPTPPAYLWTHDED